jgi:hypothetical protein
MVSAASETTANTAHSVSRVPVARLAQKNTASNPGPSPMFAPETEKVVPIVKPITANAAEELRRYVVSKTDAEKRERTFCKSDPDH